MKEILVMYFDSPQNKIRSACTWNQLKPHNISADELVAHHTLTVTDISYGYWAKLEMSMYAIYSIVIKGTWWHHLYCGSTTTCQRALLKHISVWIVKFEQDGITCTDRSQIPWSTVHWNVPQQFDSGTAVTIWFIIILFKNGVL